MNVREDLQHPVVRLGLALGGAIIVGILVAAFRPLTSERVPAVPPAVSGPASFGSYFVHFFPGRTPDGSKPKANSVLLRADKFLAGERVGVRVQTVPEIRSRLTAEIRFLSRATHEEDSGLRGSRQRFPVRPGLRTYCCLRMPRRAGEYSLGVLIGNQFVTFLPVTVKEPPRQLDGGLFVRPEQ